MNAKRRSSDPQEPLPLTPLQRELLAVMRAGMERSWTHAEALRAVAGSGLVPSSEIEAKAAFFGLSDRGLTELADDGPRRCAVLGIDRTTYTITKRED